MIPGHFFLVRPNNVDREAAIRYPRRNRQWETTDNGLVVLIMPKFGDHALGRWLMKRLTKPTYHLKLDEIGSFVWHRCDGSKTVEQIEKELHNEFGEKVEPVRERLSLFMRSLEGSKSIEWV